MNIIGKIFVFAVFIMSLVFMSFAVALYSTHTNWKQEIVKPGGLNEQLRAAKDESEKLQQNIDRLTKEVQQSEVARDNVIAQVQTSLRDKNKLLDDLRKKVDEQEQERSIAQQQLGDKSRELLQATEEIAKLRNAIKQQQQSLDDQVKRTADMAVELHEKESLLVIARERMNQLAGQVANARVLLEQSGLTVDSLPRDQMPPVDGVVTRVGNDSVELSLGGDDGLQQNHELDVYRDDLYLGRVRVLSVRPDRAVATVMKDFKRGSIQQGDKVTSRL